MGHNQMLSTCEAFLIAALFIVPPMAVSEPNNLPENGSSSEARDRTGLYRNWTDDTLLTGNGTPSNPCIAATPGGSFLVAWADNREGDASIYFKKIGPTGKTAISERKLTGEIIDANHSSVVLVVDSLSRMHLLWLGNITTDQYSPRNYSRFVCHRLFDSNGFPLSVTASLQIDEPGPWVYRNLSAAMKSDDNVSVVFEVEWDTASNAIIPDSYATLYWMELAVNGSKVAEIPLNDRPYNGTELGKQRHPAVAVDDRDRDHVIWLDGLFPSNVWLNWTVAGVGHWPPTNDTVAFGAVGPWPSLCVDDNWTVQVVYTDGGTGSLVHFSFAANGTPEMGNRSNIFTADINNSTQFLPLYHTTVSADDAGNLLVLCEGSPIGDGPPPDALASQSGLFVISPGGVPVYSDSGFIMDISNRWNGPGPRPSPPYLRPSLAIGPDQSAVCWQILDEPQANSSPARGIHLRRTMFYDLGVAPVWLNYSGSFPQENSTIRADITAFNYGERPAFNLNVVFNVDGASVNQTNLSLEAGANASFSLNWTPVRGVHNLTFEVIPGANPDMVIHNNYYWIYNFSILIPPDLFVEQAEINFTPAEPGRGDVVNFSAVIRNGGRYAVAQSRLLLDTTELGRYEIIVPSGGNTTVSVEWIALPGNHTFSVEVFNSSPAESELANNRASRNILVREGPPIEPPTISISSPADRAVLRGTVAINGTASTVYDTELAVDMRIDNDAWTPVNGNWSWNHSWNTTLSADGPHRIQARATVKGVTAVATVNVTLDNSLRGNVWFSKVYPPGNITMFEGDLAAFRVEALTEPPQAPVMFVWTSDGILSLRGYDALNYSYPTSYRSAGVHKLNVTATARPGKIELSVSYEWTITVVNVNRRPYINSAFPAADVVNTSAQKTSDFSVNATDPDGDILTYRWSFDGKMVNGSGNPTLRLVNLKAGVHTLQLNVTDGELSAERSWTINVVELEPPTVTGDWTLCLVAGAAGMVGLAIFLLAHRMRKGRGDG